MIILTTFKLSSANAFNLDQSKILSLGKGLHAFNRTILRLMFNLFNLLIFIPNDKFLGWSKLKEFGDENVYVTEKSEIVLARLENVVKKE